MKNADEILENEYQNLKDNIPTMLNDIDLGVIPLIFVFLALYTFMILFANKMSINNANKFEWLCDGKNTNAIKNKDFFAKKIKGKEDKIANTKESLKKLIDLIADMEVIRKSMKSIIKGFCSTKDKRI